MAPKPQRSDKYSVTKAVDFCYGHRIPNHKSKCKHVHGHNARLECTVEGDLDVSDPGMVLDFGDLKTILNYAVEEFDHTFLMWDKDVGLTSLFWPHIVQDSFDPVTHSAFIQGFGVIHQLPFLPTTENLCKMFYEQLAPALNNEHRRVVSVKVYEGPNSVAEYKPNG